MYACIQIYICTYVYIYICMYMCFVYVHAYVYVYVYVYAYAYEGKQDVLENMWRAIHNPIFEREHFGCSPAAAPRLENGPPAFRGLGAPCSLLRGARSLTRVTGRVYSMG